MLSLILTTMLIGQCGPDGCPAPVSQVASTYEWKKLNDDSQGLYCNGVQIGVYSPSRDTYWAVDPRTRAYSQPTKPPVVPPTTERTTGHLWQTTGVDRSKISQQERYSTQSGNVSKESALRSIADTIPNDANHMHVTFIDKDEKRAIAAMEDFKQKAPDVAKTVHVKAYQADDPTVVTSGFVTTGTPTVYIQQGQKVVGREDTYPGAEAVAQAVRKKQADYDPKKDPSIVASDPLAKLKDLVMANPIISLLVGLALLLFFRKSEKK